MNTDTLTPGTPVRIIGVRGHNAHGHIVGHTPDTGTYSVHLPHWGGTYEYGPEQIATT